ncbi:MAG: SDR family NAD(P)-dependent oxidoreductase [Magnetovibrio sp.]|nr:SDR family NAD(P)-dependent oxidoreductase [Magnetovibrio sp.]
MPNPSTPPTRIVITGASSGIGEALALAYAEPGVALFLSGRDAARLEAVAERCRGAGATVRADTVDVTDRARMAGWIGDIGGAGGLDLVVANAGISGGSGGIGGEDEEQVRDIFAVNLAGVLNTVLPVLPVMQRQGGGQIAIMSSLAGFRGLPSAPAYAASKAAVLAYGDALRVEQADRGIGVSVICPGFVVSRITDANDFPMPFLMEAGKAAQIIKRGLAKGRRRIAFPWPMRLAVWLLAALPVALTDPVLARSPRKG